MLRARGDGRIGQAMHRATGVRTWLLRQPYLMVAGLCLLAALLAPAMVSSHTLELLALAFILALFAVSFDLLWGYLGLLSFGHSAFYGLGGYGIGIIATHINGGGPLTLLILGILAGIALAGFLAVALGLIAFGRRVPVLYVAILTFVVTLVLQRVAGLGSWEALLEYTGGFNGLSFSTVDWDLQTWYWVALGVLCLFSGIAGTLVRSDFGRVMSGIRDNPDRMSYLGFNVKRLKAAVFVLSGAMAAIAGSLFATYNGFVSPDIFGFAVASQVLIVVCLGGRGTIIGPILGAVAIGLIEPSISASNPESWQLILGATFIAVVLLAPQGVLPAVRKAIAVVLARLRHEDGGRRERTGTSFLVPLPSEPRDGALPIVGSVDGVAKNFGSLAVLRSVSIEFHSSQILCIIGPNGAGKSTLMNVITDASELVEGDVMLCNQRVSGQSPERIARLGVGRTFQGTKLMETHTVADSLFVAACRGRVPSLWRRSTAVPVPAQIVELASHTELDEVLDVPVADLSHGKRQALELCMAMALQPQLLFLDEPTAGLTSEERTEVGQLLQTLVSDGLSVVLIEHDLEFVRRITDRVAILHRGELVADGEVETIAESGLIKEIYLGGAV